MDPAAQSMKRKPLTVLWMGMAFGAALGIAAAEVSPCATRVSRRASQLTLPAQPFHTSGI